MIVRNNRLLFNSGSDEEISKGGFDFGLSRFEIVSDDENVVSFGHLDNPGNEGVLGGSVDVRGSFQNSSDGVDGGGGNFSVVVFDGVHQVFLGVVDSGFNFTESFGVGGP